MVEDAMKPGGTKIRHKGCGGAVFLFRGLRTCADCRASVPEADEEVVTIPTHTRKRRASRPGVDHYQTVGRAATYSRRRSR